MANDSPDWKAASDVAPIDMGDVVIPKAQLSGTLIVQLPVTTTGLFLMLHDFAQSCTISVQGGVTGMLYAALSAAAHNPALFGVPNAGAKDNPITLTVTVPAALSPSVDTPVLGVLAVTGAGFTQVWNSFNDALWVQFQSTPTVDIGTMPAITIAAAQSVGITGTVPVSIARWPGTPLSIDSVLKTADLAAGATVPVLAGAAGKVVTVYGYSMSVTAAVPATLGQYGAALRSDVLFNPVGNVGFQTGSAVGYIGNNFAEEMAYGLPMPTGEGLQLAADAGNVGTIRLRTVVKFKQV